MQRLSSLVVRFQVYFRSESPPLALGQEVTRSVIFNQILFICLVFIEAELQLSEDFPSFEVFSTSPRGV